MSTNIDTPTPPPSFNDEEGSKQFFAEIERQVKANPAHPLVVGRLDGNPIQVRAPWAPSGDKWLQGVEQVGAQRWLEGIQKPRADFKSAAIANNAGYKAEMAKALAEDRFLKGMEKVSTEDAIATAVAIGPQGYAAGAAARKAKFDKNVAAIQAKMSGVVAAVRAMPAATDADREKRMLEMVRGAKKAAQ